MATIVTRSGKGSPLTHAEVDSNFTNLNTDKLELSGGTMTGNLSFGDNDKAIFGAGSDLQIYHDGSHSYIDDAGTGNLTIRANQINFDKYTGEAMARFRADGNTELFYDNAAKLATTSTGIDVTGTVTADGLTVDGVAEISAANTRLNLYETDTTDKNTQLQSSNSRLMIKTLSDDGSTATERLRVDHSTGSISFYEDTGVTPKFFWDASAESLGIGTSSPAAELDVVGATAGSGTAETVFRLSQPATTIGAHNEIRSGVTLGTDPYLAFAVREGANPFNTVERMRIDDSGNVGIGTTPSGISSYKVLHLKGGATNNGGMIRLDTSDGSTQGRIYTAGDMYFDTTTSSAMIFKPNNTEAMRIDSSGNLLVGKTAQDQNVAGSQLTADGVGAFTATSTSPLRVLRLTDEGVLINLFQGGTSVGIIGVVSGDAYIATGDVGLRFDDGNNILRPVNSSGSDVNGTINLGGPNQRFASAYLSGDIFINDQTNGATRKIYFDMKNSGGAQTDFSLQANNGNFLFYSESTGSERMRIDSSGDLLLGKTTAASTTAGMHLDTNGKITTTRSSGPAAAFVRLTSDGSIVSFQKDSTTVGSIGSASGNRIYIGTGNSTLGFSPVVDAVYGYSGDNTVDLGTSATRFKDLYLSGGVYLGGTGAANKLDDYEEGSWTPTAIGDTGSATLADASGKYVKIGGLVHITCEVDVSSVNTATGNVFIGGLPFTVADVLSPTGIEASAAVGFWQGFSTAINSLSAAATAGQTYCALYGLTSSTATGKTTITWSDFGAGEIRLTLTYRA